MLPAEKIDREIAYLQIAIDKTAGPRGARAGAGWSSASPLRAHRRQRPDERPARQRQVGREAEIARHEGGRQFIDFKDPDHGALAALPARSLPTPLPGRRHGTVSAPPQATCRCQPALVRRGVAAIAALESARQDRPLSEGDPAGCVAALAQLARPAPRGHRAVRRPAAGFRLDQARRPRRPCRHHARYRRQAAAGCATISPTTASPNSSAGPPRA